MAIASGTLFLLDLHRRALADGRLHVLELAATAALLGAIATVIIQSPELALYASGAAAVVWGAVTAGLLHYAREELRRYIQPTLLDSGLMYLALEHEPAELLRGLRQGTRLLTLAANPAGSISFASRMQALLRFYPACANAVGFHPFPAWARYTALVLVTLLTGLMICVITMLYNIMYQISELSIDPQLSLLRLATYAMYTIAVYMLNLTFIQARRTAAMLALVDILHGPVQPGRATLTRA
jgi:hypothetical protein